MESLLGTLKALLQSGALLNLIVLLIAAEVALLLLANWRWQRPRYPLRLLPNLVSGAVLMLCVKEALVGGATTTLLMLLGVSFVAHGIDLWLRLGRGG